MNQRLLLLATALGLLTAVQADAQQRSLKEMQRIASERFTASHQGAKMAKGKAEGVLATYSNNTFTVFTPEAGLGFVIVSANEQMPEVLGACDDATFDVERTQNPGLNALLDSYTQASEMIANGEATAAEMFGTSANIVSAGSAKDYLAPMLGKIAFNQGSPYNSLCPSINDSLCQTGCGPTSLAQIMKYYQYPEHGTGYVNYTTTTRHLKVEFDFDNTTFDWANIKDTYSKTADITEALPVATLMKACGAAARADYGPEETTTVGAKLWGAAYTYFGYDPDSYYVTSSALTADEMANAAKNELDNGHIVPVSGRSFVKTNPQTGAAVTEGHSYLIDGYDFTGENPMFHINWGWNGSSNSFFLLTRMRPSEAGTGGRTDNYSYEYDLYMNIKIDDNKEEGWAISCSSVKLNSSSENIICNRGNKITVTLSKLGNNSNTHKIEEKVYVYLVSAEGKAYKITSYYLGDYLAPGETFKGNKSLNIEIPATIPDGTYHVECRLNENDHFFCHANPTLTIKDPAGIENVQSDANKEDAMMLDLYGRKVNGTPNGIVIKNRKKFSFDK